MVVCRFFQAGKCAYGNSCKFEHPDRAPGFGTQAGGLVNEGFTVSGDTITADLTKERPIWRLSSYAPGRDPPAQLVDGKDVSPEEMRFRAWELNMQGLGQQFANEATQLESAIDTQINNILRDIPGAVRFMTDANKNRDGYRYKTPSGTDLASIPTAPASASAFGAAASALGAPAATSSTFGQQTSAFGAPIPPTSAFGQSQQTTSAFGQPVQPAQPTSAFGAPAQAFAAKTPAFGQTSMGLGSTTTPAFGQPAFGKPAFGQPAFGQPAFGVTAAPVATTTTAPAFGQTAFSSAAPTSAFGGSTAQQQPASAFGATAITQPTSAFGKPAFGAPAFGQPAFGQTASPFATAAAGQQQAANPFAQVQQPSTPTTSTFGQPVNAFASPAQQAPMSAFSQPQQQQQQQQQQPVSAFSQQQQPVSAFGAPTAGAPIPGVFGQPTNAFAQQPPAGQASTSAFGQTAFAQPQQPTSAFGGGGGGSLGNLLNPQKEAPVASMGGAAAGASAGSTGGKWDDPPIRYTEEEIQAFKAPDFVLGRIPCVPPPQEMCR